MKKNVFGLLIIGILVGIVVINLVKDSQLKRAEKEAQEDFLRVAEQEMDKQVELGNESGTLPHDFELQTLDGEVVKLSDLKGKKVILNFWATWCPPCKAEMPHMQNYYENYAEDDNVEIVAVNLTTKEHGQNIEKKITNFIEEYQLSFPIPLDEKGKANKEYRISMIPTTYLINTDGLINQKVIGPLDEERIKKLVKEMK